MVNKTQDVATGDSCPFPDYDRRPMLLFFLLLLFNPDPNYSYNLNHVRITISAKSPNLNNF